MDKKGKFTNRGKIPVKPNKLTAKMMKFIEAYLLDPCSSRAAVSAGYSVKSRYSSGPELLKNPLISDSIRSRRASENETSELTRAYVIEGIKKVIKKAGNEKVRSTELKGWELLGKMEGSLDPQVKKIELTGKDGRAIEYSDKSRPELEESIKHRLRSLREGAGSTQPN